MRRTFTLGLVWLLLGTGCSNGPTDDGGTGGFGGDGIDADGRYVISDPAEDCDGVDGLRASAILDATGLTYEGELSWTDLETGYESSRTTVQIEVMLAEGGTTTCIPYRHFPGQAPEYARVSYDAATMVITTEDGLLDEAGDATVWLAETASEGEFALDVVRALPVGEAAGAFEVSPVLGGDYETLVLVYSPSEATPVGHVSAAREAPGDILGSGLISAGVPHGYFPALAE